MPGSVSFLLRLGQPQPAVTPGEERRGDLGEVALDGVEGLLEAPLDGLGQIVAQGLQLVERAFEILALRAQLVEPLLLGGVLLLRERVDAAELLAPPLEPLELGLRAPPAGLRPARRPPARAGGEPRRARPRAGRARRRRPRPAPNDSDRPRRSSTSRPPSARSSAASSPGPDRAAVGVGEQRRLQPLGRPRRRRQALDERRARRHEPRVGQPWALRAAPPPRARLPPRGASAAGPRARGAPPRPWRR